MPDVQRRVGPRVEREIAASLAGIPYYSWNCEVRRHVSAAEWFSPVSRPEAVFELLTHQPHVDLHPNALEILEILDEEARVEGYEPVSEEARSSARRILRQISNEFSLDYDVYPTAEREVAIRAGGGRGRSVLILCDSKGGAACFASFDGSKRRARWADASLVPDGFVREALSELLRR